MFKRIDIFSTISDITNIVDLGTNLLTTKMVINRTKRAENTLLISSIAMSALAVSVSVIQSMSIKNSVRKECEELENNVRDIILRTMQ